MKNNAFIVLGMICFGLAGIGAALPVLPSTPFLLCALACFGRGSVRFHNWLVSTALYKKHLESFVMSRSMSKRTKFTILASATLMILPIIILVPILPMRIFLICLLAVKYYYFIFRIKSES